MIELNRRSQNRVTPPETVVGTAVTGEPSVRVDETLPSLSLASGVVGFKELIKRENESFLSEVQYRERVDLAISHIRSPLFRFADKVSRACRKDPITSIIIEDTSGRFVGRFIAAVLADDTGRVPILFVKPANHTKSEGYQEFKTKMEREIMPYTGTHPLVISEYVHTGNQGAMICKVFAERRVHPTYAALFYNRFNKWSAQWKITSKLEAYYLGDMHAWTNGVMWRLKKLLCLSSLNGPENAGARRLILGEAAKLKNPNMWTRAPRAIGNPAVNRVRHVHENAALNGVSCNRGWKGIRPLAVQPFRLADSSHGISLFPSADTPQAKVRQRAVNYAREKLGELIDEYRKR